MTTEQARKRLGRTWSTASSRCSSSPNHASARWPIDPSGSMTWRLQRRGPQPRAGRAMAPAQLARVLLLSAVAAVVAAASGGGRWQQQEFLISFCGGPMNTTQQRLNAHGLLYSTALWLQIKGANFTVTNNYGFSDEWALQLATARAAQLPMMIALNRVVPSNANSSSFPASYARNFSSLPWPPRGDPMVLGYWLADEPSRQLFRPYAAAAEQIGVFQPGALRWVNLLPSYASPRQTGFANYSEYVMAFASMYARRGVLDALSIDFYPNFAPNAATSVSSPTAWLQNIALLRQVSLLHSTTEHIVPWWSYVKARAIFPGDREPTAAETAWQAFTSIAYGARGLLHFTYNTALVDATSGRVTPHYETARALNSRLLALGPTLLRLRSTRVASVTRDDDGVRPRGAGPLMVNITGDAYDRLTIGEFSHVDGRSAVIICNDDVGRSASPRINFSIGRVVELDQHSGKEIPLQSAGWFKMVNNDELSPSGGGGAPHNRVYLGPGEGRLFLAHPHRGSYLIKTDDMGDQEAAPPLPPAPPPYLGNMSMDRYTLSGDTEICLDGSPGVFYMRNGTGSGSQSFYIHHQGGGWCESLSDCAGRSRTHLGSSRGYEAEHLTGQIQNHGRGCPSGGYFSTLEETNPLMWNWNVVYLFYCDGGSWTGSRSSAYRADNSTLHFHGKDIRDGVQEMLMTKLGLDRATDVVISGASAGALAVYLTVDRWCDAVRAQSPSATCVGMPDAGYFLDYQAPMAAQPPAPGAFHAGMRWDYDTFNSSGGVNRDCVAAKKRNDAPECMFAQHTAPFIRAPIFALQSQYDAWQLGSVLLNASASNVNELGANITNRLESTLLRSHPDSGVFFDSCVHHTFWGSSSDYFSSIRIDGDLVMDAFKTWYLGLGNSSAKKVWWQREKYPCADCCGLHQAR